jgi:hypothetical protein
MFQKIFHDSSFGNCYHVLMEITWWNGETREWRKVPCFEDHFIFLTLLSVSGATELTHLWNYTGILGDCRV